MSHQRESDRITIEELRKLVKEQEAQLAELEGIIERDVDQFLNGAFDEIRDVLSLADRRTPLGSSHAAVITINREKFIVPREICVEFNRLQRIDRAFEAISSGSVIVDRTPCGPLDFVVINAKGDRYPTDDLLTTIEVAL